MKRKRKKTGKEKEKNWKRKRKKTGKKMSVIESILTLNKALQSTGSLIDEFDADRKYNEGGRRDGTGRNLSSLFSDEKRPCYFFENTFQRLLYTYKNGDQIFERCDKFYYNYSLPDSKETVDVVGNKKKKNLKGDLLEGNFFDKINPNHFTKAEFGSVVLQKTLIDDNIRRGMELRCKNLQDHIVINPDLISELEQYVVKYFHVYGARVVPDKILFYKEGDFFKPHRDSPESGLFATIIVIADGNNNCFKLYKASETGEASQASQASEAILDRNFYYSTIVGFYTNVVHEIIPLNKNEYRECITFKVYGPDNSQVLANTNCNTREHDTFLSFLNSESKNRDIGILLENTYTVVDEKTQFKGNDLLIIDILKLVGKKIEFYPVMVKQMVKNTGDPYEKERFDLQISNISPELIKLLDLKNVVTINGKLDIYYLEFGEFLYQNTDSDEQFHIGNSYEGCLHENIYLNHVMVISNK